jgi:hypothetical protein
VAIRAAAFAGDLRQFRDMRRSGVMEAFAGRSDARAVSEKFGNSIDRSSFLFKTYNPVDLEKVRQTDAARLEDADGGTKNDLHSEFFSQARITVSELL